MTFKFRSMAAAVAFATFSMTAAGCGVGGGSSSTSSNATTASAGGSGATSADNGAASSGNRATSTATASPGSITPDCQAYLTTLQTCVDHLSTLDPAATAGTRTAADAVAQVRRELQGTRDNISRNASMQDEICISGAAAWNSAKESLGC